MKKITAEITAILMVAALFTVNSYAMTKEDVYELKTYVFIQGKTAEKINNLFKNMNEGEDSTGLAVDKMIEWKGNYKSECVPAPKGAEELDGLMNDYFSAMDKYVEAFQADDNMAKMQLKSEIQEFQYEIKSEEERIKVEIEEYEE